MIRYALMCCHGHRFEGWFASSEAFDEQRSAGQLSCPHCGTDEVDRALMAPTVRLTPRSTAPEPTEGAERDAPPQDGEILPPSDRAPERDPTQRQEVLLNDPRMENLRAAARAIRAAIEEHATNVGKRFPEEARRIHYGETEERAIYGEATLEDVSEMLDEGIEVLPVPGRGARSN